MTSSRTRLATIGLTAVIAVCPHPAYSQPPPSAATATAAPAGPDTARGGTDDAGRDAGLPRGAVPEVLNWRRLYTRAIRLHGEAEDRENRRLEASLDGADLDQRAARADAAGFQRFQGMLFLADPPFADPAGPFLDLLCRSERIRNARRREAAAQRLAQRVAQAVVGPNSGLTQLDADHVSARVQQARQRLDTEILAYRDRLEAFRLALGLAPRAPLVPDRGALDPFRLCFDQLERWQREPKREVAALASLVQTLPSIGDVEIQGHPVLSVIERDPAALESALTTAVELMARSRGREPGAAGNARILAVRRRLRHLAETRRAYERERSMMILRMRLWDHAMDRTLAPRDPNVPESAAARLGHLFEAEEEIVNCQDRLVSLWTTFRADRLAFYRELGILPYRDWDSFYRQFDCTPAAAPTPTPTPTPTPGSSPP